MKEPLENGNRTPHLCPCIRRYISKVEWLGEKSLPPVAVVVLGQSSRLHVERMYSAQRESPGRGLQRASCSVLWAHLHVRGDHGEITHQKLAGMKPHEAPGGFGMVSYCY